MTVVTDGVRESERYDISIVGTLRTGTGKREVTIVDLSEEGCRIFDRMGYLSPNLSVTIKIGPVGPIDATVRWQEQPYAGIRFDNPLYPAVLEHIRAHFDLRELGSGAIEEMPQY
ncbi:PilZ domain-containing protein [Aurantiacibacter gilvus]|uniref:PilZ domain-containing protein n=1 Tax=Aurantiacibacter gilvus TaxID=3139141 RepID=A0ABU9IDJ9_9SPHN